MSSYVDTRLRHRLDVQARGLALWAQLGLVGYVFVAAVDHARLWWVFLLGVVLLRDAVRFAVLWSRRSGQVRAKQAVWHLWMGFDIAVFFIVIPVTANVYAVENLLLALIVLPWSLAVALHARPQWAFLSLAFASGAATVYYLQTSDAATWPGTWAQLGVSVFGIAVLRYTFVRSTGRLRAHIAAVKEAHVEFDKDMENLCLGVAYRADGESMAKPLSLSLLGACYMLHRDLAKQGRGLRFDARIAQACEEFRISLTDVHAVFTIASQFSEVGYEIHLGTLLAEEGRYVLPVRVAPHPLLDDADVSAALSGRLGRSADGQLRVYLSSTSTLSGAIA